MCQTVIYELRDAMSGNWIACRRNSRQAGLGEIKPDGKRHENSVADLIHEFDSDDHKLHDIIGILIMMLRISVLMTVTALVDFCTVMIVIKLVVSIQGHFKSAEVSGPVNDHVKCAGLISSSVQPGKGIAQVSMNTTINCARRAEVPVPVGYHDADHAADRNLAHVAVCLLGGYLAINGKVSIGDIQAFIQYVRSFNQPISQVANVANQLQSTAAAAERVFELLEEEEEVDLAKTPACSIEPSKVRGKVSFEHVSFGYETSEPVINDFSFTAQPGQRVAIVGPTGAGKTTIVKLLITDFYELNGGCIRVDDHDIKEFSRANLRQMFGMVLQDTWLNSGTIRDNIRYGRRDATDEEVEAAAKAAHIVSLCRTRPKNTMEINEEANNISQGQKRLLTIARALWLIRRS